MALYRPIPFIHHQLEKHLSPSALVVDATVGNGHDSEYITSLLGYRGQLFGFDIQEAAITATAEKVKNANCRTTLFHKSHAEMFTTLSHFAERIDCVIFNLGFCHITMKQSQHYCLPHTQQFSKHFVFYEKKDCC